jgi:hypothetical protein
VRVERWPVHRLVAGAACPGGVPAAVAKAGLMSNEDFAGAEGVPVRASRRRSSDPLPGCCLHQLAGIWHASMLFAVLTWRIGNPSCFESEVWLPGDYETTYVIATIC